MAINLDEIISSSNSVDDVVAALQNETAAQIQTRAQAKKLAQAGQSALNPLEWLKGMLDPKSPAGGIANRDAYRQYYLQTVGEGKDPITEKEFLKVMKDQREHKKEGV
jgi:hypothetical protein